MPANELPSMPTEMIQDKYRQIEIGADETLDESIDPAIDALNEQFDPDDFFVTRTDHSVNVWLRQIDLRALRSAMDAAETPWAASGPLAKIIPAIDDIRNYGINGRKRLYVGYNRERKVVGRKTKERRRGKHYYARDHDFEKDDGLLPSRFRDSIVCGDSERVLKAMPDNCIDLVFTSPPYNFGLGYSDADAGQDDSVDWESYFAKLFSILDECVRVVKFGGRIIVNVQPLFSDYIPSHHMISNHLMKRRVIWKGEILWDKNNYNCKYTAWGSWKSPSSPYLKYTWEFLEVFCKGDLRKTGDSANADIDAESFKQWVVAKWSIAPERKMRAYGHPAMFPEELARRVLLLFSFRGDTVLDPFCGVGTTCLAARRHGRSFLGVDVSKTYCKTARERLADMPVSMFVSD